MRNYFSKLGTQVPWRTSQSRGATLALPLRYLSALLILLTLSIGQSWAALTAHTPGVYEKATDEGGYGATIVTVDERDYEVYGFSYNSSGAKPQILWAGTSTNNASASQVLCSNLSATPQEIAGWISMSTAGKSSTYSMPSSTEFAASSVGSSGLYQMKMQGHSFTIKVKGYDQFSFLGNDNNGTQSKNKYMQVTINGSDVTKDLSSSTTVRRYDLNATIESTIVITGLGGSNEHIDAFSLRLPEAPTCSTEITTQPSGATLAVDDANPELSIVATNVASYAWKESSNGTSYDGVSSLGSSASFTPSVNDAVQTKYYYCEVTSSCDGTTVVKSNIVTVNVVGTISYYTVTLNPAGGTIVDATGWTLNAGNYEKEVAEGTVLTLPTFTKTDRAFKTWRKAGPADVASPVTVDGDLSLTAIWTATIEQVIYSWEGAKGGATEVGGTAQSSTNGGSSFDNAQINVPQAGYYCIQLNGKNDYSTNLVEITLSGDEKVKTGDKIKYTGFYNNADTKNAAPKMRAADGTAIFSGSNLPNITTSEPRTDTHVVPSGINTATVQLTRAQTQSSSFLANLQIIRDVQVEEGYLLTVTFDTKGGSSISPVMVASGQTIAKPADPTKAHNRFKEWQLSGSAYNFSTPVTASITLDAVWNPLYTVTYAANGGSGTMTDANEYAAGDEVTLLTNTFDAPDASKIWDSWAVTDASDNSVAVSEGKFAMPNSAATVTAQWATISDFDVKFFQGYGDPDVQIGTTQTVSTGNYATAPAEDPERAGFAFLGWSYDATEAHIVDVATYGITAATNFTAMWKAVWTVTFDGAGAVNVEDGEAVASPNSPVMAGKVFQGWYNAEVKYDFSAAVTGNLALTSKWADADPNHYVYAYNDDFHFDGVVYKTPEGKVDAGNGNETINLDASVTLFSGTEGITSVVAANAQYDSKGNDARGAAIQYVTAMLKLKNEATSKVTVTIKSGYTATLKIKSSGFSATRTVNVSGATPESGITTGSAVGGSAPYANTNGELTFALTSGAHDITVTGGTLYISELDIEATALPAHTVTYMPGEGTGAEFIIDDDATEVSDGSTMFTAPEGKIFHGWKDALDNDVAVGAIVEADMTLTAQWIAHYAVTFDMQGHGTQIVAQDIVHGSKAVKPADPVVMGWDFGGWFTDAECTAGNEFDFETPITAATPLFAKWTEFEGCALLYPALSGDALHVGDNVAVQTGSKGGVITIVGMKTDGSSIAYNARGLQMGGGSADVISVTLNNDMADGTKITVTLDAKAGGRPRGLYLLNGEGGNVKDGTLLGWPDDGSEDVPEGEIGTFSYTVEASDGLEGTNVFRLKRQNSTYIKCIKVESCGAAITYHNLTSEVNIAGKGTVTLGASSVREGYTTTATYSEIDPLYEFVNWTVSGTGASVADATANPATITVGTEDAVVTLNLQLIPVKFTVNYFDGTTPMGSELVPVNQHPTASEIETAKRGYVFEGWGMSSTATASDVVALNTITSVVEATINLYAVYTEIPCPTEGNLFTWTINSEADEIEYPVVKNVEIDMMSEAGVMNISGGTVSVGTTSSSSTFSINDGAFAFRANSSNYMRIELDCALQVGDVVSYVSDNSANRYMSIYKDDMSGTAVTTATDGTRKYIVANNESPIYGAYVLYIKGSNSDSNFKTFRIDRPYTITFDLQGHGDAITAQKLIAGDKVAEPTAPTATGWDFKGWYKESACTNAWDFENDVVAGTMALYAKWDVHVTNDATLKSLKYGSEAIALEDGVFEYNIGLPAMTVAVPALTAVANSMPVHSLDIVNASAFDGDGKATSKVTVVSEDETVTQVYTVNFSKLTALPQVNVTESTTWNFSAGGSTTLTNQSDIVLANLPGINNDANFNSQALLGSFNKLEGTYFQGSKLGFITEVAGKLTITFRGTNGNTRHLQVCIGDGETVVADWVYNSSSTSQTKTVFVPVGKVTLKAFEGETPNNARIYQMIFNATPDYTRDLTEGRYGTICLPNGGIMVGAELFEIAYYGETTKKIFLDNVPSGETVAGRPYIFYPNQGVSQLAVFYTDEANAEAGNRNGLFGFIGADAGEYFNIPAGVGNYILQNNLYREVLAGAQARILSNRAYINLGAISPTEPALAPGRRRISMGVQSEQVATGIGNVQGDEVQSTKVLINGQLFILRGEKIYDATGRLVK